jgi:hypothetical protein
MAQASCGALLDGNQCGWFEEVFLYACHADMMMNLFLHFRLRSCSNLSF